MHDHFLKMICDNPADIGPRMVYADWLEEQGDPRGEFIRVQCALSGMNVDDPQRANLEQRERALLREHEKEWLRPLEQLLGPNEPRQPVAAVTSWIASLLPREIARAVRGVATTTFPAWHARLKHGFSEYLEIDAERLSQFGQAVPMTTPLRELFVFTASTSVDGVLAWLTADLMRHVEFLEATFRLDRDAWQRIWNAVDCPALRRLSATGIPADGLQTIVDVPFGQRLESLDISQSPLPESDLRNLSRLPRLTRLALLNVAFDTRMFIDLSNQPVSQRIEDLAVYHCPLGDSEMLGLAIGAFGKITKLEFDRCELGDATAASLAQTPRLRQLHCLKLVRNQISDRGALALADSPYLLGQTVINLRYNPISPDVRRALKVRFGDRILVDEP